jgi:hypothetical protein
MLYYLTRMSPKSPRDRQADARARARARAEGHAKVMIRILGIVALALVVFAGVTLFQSWRRLNRDRQLLDELTPARVSASASAPASAPGRSQLTRPDSH